MARKKSFGKRFNTVVSTINSPTLRVGFSNIDKWISSGNYAMNRLWSGTFTKALLFGRNYVYYGESGCHSKDTGILMHDGTTKFIQDIKLGDMVMGPDSVPRLVNGLYTGCNAPMYEMRILGYKPFVVTGDHVLSLCDHKGEISNLSVKDYISSSQDLCMYSNPINPNITGSIDDDHFIKKFKKAMFGTTFPILGRWEDNIIRASMLPYASRKLLWDDLREKFSVGSRFIVTSKMQANAMVKITRSMGMICDEPIPTESTYEIQYSMPTNNYAVYHKFPFSIKHVGLANYYGINVSGDHLYVMDNYIVTHNSGKSLFAAVAAANAQKDHDAFICWIDVEHANDDNAGKEWLTNAGVSLDDDNFMYTSASTLEEIKTIIAKICVEYKTSIKNGDEDELPPVVFVVDSWAAALTSSQWEKTGGKEAGRVVGDQGQKAKQLGDVIGSVTHLCAGLPIMVLGMQHIMDNQDPYGRKHKTTGGNKMLYYASGCIMLTKKELKLEDVVDASVKEKYAELGKGMLADVRKAAGGDRKFVGITATMEIIKSRVSKPFEKIMIQIPYDTGIDPYSGLFELMMQEGTIRKGSPGWFEYDMNKETTKFRRADFNKHADALMKLSSKPENIEVPENEK